MYPPQVIKADRDGESLYHAGLVPAAHVHVGLDDKKGEAGRGGG